ncbi:MAG: hemolysin III family protein [Pirellulales bacterium]
MLSMLAQIAPIPGFNEPFSSLSHYLGAAVFAVLGVVLIARGRGDRVRVAALSVYVFTLLFMLSMSGTFHLVRRGTVAHEVIGRLDYASIFLLIAGTFTPPHAILFRGWGRWGAIALIWTIAVVGVTFKAIFYQQFTHGISVVIFIAMGWIGAFGGAVAWRRYGFEFVKPLFAGALAYTIGALFEVMGTILVRFPAVDEWYEEVAQQWLFWPGVIESHEIWHVAVLLGAAFHWAFIYQFADGSAPPVIDRASKHRPAEQVTSQATAARPAETASREL